MQLGQRLLAGLVDGRQGGAGLPGPLVQQVQGHPRLHVDERDLVGQHIVQLPGDEQALLAGATAVLLPRHLGPLGAPLEADTGDLAGRAGQRQPGEVGGRLGGAAGPLHLVGVQGRQPDEGGEGDHQHGPREGAPAHHDGARHGEPEGGEPGRSPGVAAGGIAGGGGEGDHQRGLGPAPTEQQPGRPGDEQQVGDGVERPRAGLSLTVDHRPGDLDDGDHHGDQHVLRPGPQPLGRREPVLPPPGPAVTGPGGSGHPVVEAGVRDGGAVGGGHASTVGRRSLARQSSPGSSAAYPAR